MFSLARTSTAVTAVTAAATALSLSLATPAQAQSSQYSEIFAGSSEERAQSSENSSTIDASSNESSLGSSILSGPFFAPLLSSQAESDSSSDGSENLSSDTSFIVESDVDMGPEPKLLSIEKVADGKEGNSDNYYEITVWSPANKAIVRNSLLLPEGGQANTTPRPTVYLFAGAHGGDAGVNWHTETDFEDFFADKPVNVVSLMGGAASMYADWYRDDKHAGHNQWATYMGEELPQIMEENFYDDGTGALAGCSMGGAPALNIAGKHPQRFKAAGSLSGYPAQSGLVGRMLVKGIINDANMANLYGNFFDPAWLENDPTWDPLALKDTKVFVGSGWGIPTANELVGDWVWGTFLEGLSQFSSNYYYRKARSLGVDITRYQTVFGAHTYVNFEQELYAAWDQVFAPALGISA